MPFYEYECAQCGHYAEVMRKISDPPLRKCPACNKQALRKLVSAPVFRLKGSGWYETDFKTDKDQKRNLAGEGSAEKTEAKSDAKPDDKTETKSEPKSEPKAEAKAAPKSEGAGKKTKSRTVAKPAAKRAAKSAARRK